MNEITWKDLNDLGLSVVLPKIAIPIFFVFCLLAFLRFIFLKVECINKYFDDKTNRLNIILNYISTYSNETIIVLCIILTMFTLFNLKIKFNINNMITIFIFMFAILRLLTQLFFNI